MPNDYWRPVPGWPLYEVSRMGEVRTWNAGRWGRAKEPKPITVFKKKNPASQNKHSYFFRVADGRYHRKEKLINRTVWEAFMGPVPNGYRIIHKNKDLSDNCLNNLAIVSISECGKHGGANSKRRPVVRIDREGNILECFSSARAAAQRLPFSYQSVTDRCNHRIKKDEFDPMGYSFRWDSDEFYMEYELKNDQ